MNQKQNRIMEAYRAAYLDCARIFEKKNSDYGSSAFDVDPEVPEATLWLRLSDVRRKVVRLNRLTADAANGDIESLQKLLSDYEDLANYALMAVVAIRYKEFLKEALK